MSNREPIVVGIPGALRETLDQRNISYSDLSEATGLKRATVGRVVAGADEGKGTTRDKALAIATALDLPVADLFTYVGGAPIDARPERPDFVDADAEK